MTIRQRTWSQALASSALLVLTSCGGAAPAATSAATPAPSAAAATATTAATAICDQLREPLSRLLEQELTVRAADVHDLQTGQIQAGCAIEAAGTAAQWGDFMAATKNFQLVLAQYRWGPGVPLADGPTGTVLAFAQDDQHIQLTVDSQPAPEVSCPADQPISACTIPPEQQLITIKLEGF